VFRERSAYDFFFKSLINSNNHSSYSLTIRNLITNHFPKIKLIWIPSHIRKAENENADKTPKEAHTFPLTYTPNNNANDISHFLKGHIKSKLPDMHNRVSTWYKQILQSFPQTMSHISIPN